MAVVLAGARPGRRAVALRGEPAGRLLARVGLSEHLVPARADASRSGCRSWLVWGSCFRKVRLIAGELRAAGALIVLGLVIAARQLA